MSLDTHSLHHYARWSILVAFTTILLKSIAWYATGSVGLLSDALEGLVNLVSASITLAAVSLSTQPPDEEHAFGHDKVEFFASGFQGALILMSALLIAFTAGMRLLAPQPLQHASLGIICAGTAAVMNGALAYFLFKAGKRHRSPALTAEGAHLMSDVWTTAGVLLALIAVAWTGWLWLDPVIALLIACHLAFTARRLIVDAFHGLMDRALEPDLLAKIQSIFAAHEQAGIQFHALRTRSTGSRRHISLHMLVPDHWSIRQAHDLSEKIEEELRQAIAGAVVFTHLEPQDDPRSWHDIKLDRTEKSHS